jgi:hypothetical protein
MTDLKLVAPDQPTPFERMLLDSVAHEAPSAEQRMRVRQALGLPAVAVVAAPVAQAGRRAALFKAAAGGLVAVSAVVLLVWSGVGRRPQTVVLQPSLAAPVASVAPAQLATAPMVASAPEPVAEALPPLEQAPVKARSRSPRRISSSTTSQSAGESGSDLSEQLRLIETARAAVAAGSANAAATAIASYRSRFPRGPFGQEAAVLQIETLDLQGSHAQAASLARAFLARHPNSPHVGLVQRIADRNR